MKCVTCKEEKNILEFHKKNIRCKECYKKWYQKNRYRICENCKVKYNGKSKFCSNKCKILKMSSKNENNCWEWIGPITLSGYAQTRDIENKGHILAHRLSFIVFKGKISKGLCVCHTCDNKL